MACDRADDFIKPDEQDEEDSTQFEGSMSFGNKSSAITFIVGLMESMDISSEEVEGRLLIPFLIN